MNARLLTTATLVSVLSGLLPAKAADPQLLNLVMPDAKVLAGVNVDQAKTTPMGQYILGQIQAQGGTTHLQQLNTLTGFDPTRDIHEVLVATNGGPNEKTGLFLARGNFDPARIATFLSTHNAATQTYNGFTIIGDPKGQGGIAFLSSTIAAGGDMANLKAAIDRQRTTTSSLPVAVSMRVNQWSTSQDAWAITTVPPTSLAPMSGMPPIPGVGQQPGQSNAFTNIQHASAGVKFGANVVLSAQAQAATAQDATQIGDTVKLLASLAQLQANGDPKVLALAQSLKVETNSGLLNVTVSMPQDQLIALLKTPPKPAAQRQMHKK